MNLLFDESFEKSIKKLKDKRIKIRVIDLIETFQEAENIAEVPNIKKMQGFQSFYRVRLGDYRVGFELLEDNTIYLILIAHRKDIYKYFP